ECEGGEAEYQVTVIDVTERRRAEDAQRLLAEAGAGLASSLDEGGTPDAPAPLAGPPPAHPRLVDMVRGDRANPRVAAARAARARQALADELRRYPPVAQGHHPAMRALRSGRAEVAERVDDATLAANARNADHLAVVRRLGFASYLCIPLAARGRV